MSDGNPDKPLPPRVEALRQAMIAEIPCSPDTGEVRAELAGMRVRDLFATFYNWASRRLPPRPRTVQFAPGFWDAGANADEQTIYDLAGRIRRGEDLSGFLSNRVGTDGYVPRPAGKRR